MGKAAHPLRRILCAQVSPVAERDEIAASAFDGRLATSRLATGCRPDVDILHHTMASAWENTGAALRWRALAARPWSRLAG